MEIKILGYENIMKTIYYEIEINDGRSVWTVNSRFSDMYGVHQDFVLANKNKKMPDFPPKKMFGSDSPKFIDQRRKNLEIYFSNVVKYEARLKYNMAAWMNFFKENKETKKQSPKNSMMSLDRKDNRLKSSLDATKDDVPEKDTDEKIYDEFCKRLIIVENKLFSFEDQQRNSFPVNADVNNMGFAVADANEESNFESKNQNFLIDLLDFCSHVDEIVINQGLQAKKNYKREVIGNIKLDY